MLSLLHAGCKLKPKPQEPLVEALAEQLSTPPPLQACIVATAIDEVGIREEGFNAGARVKEYQASTGAAANTPYCASGMHWTFRQCDRVLEPRWEFAAAARWAKEHIIFKKGHLDMYQDGTHGHSFQRISMDGDVFTLWYSKLNRVGHVGMVVAEDEDYLTTVEMNTGPGGEREGEGVFLRKRSKEAVHTINRWWDDDSERNLAAVGRPSE